jgi:RNA polymerase sigma-70 factor (ECF subfamily)
MPSMTMAKLNENELADHIPMIRRYLAKMLRPDELEDGTQTVLTRALENIDKFRGDSSPRVWLLGIARNVGFEIARARQRRPRQTEPGDEVSSGDLLVSDAPSQEEQLGRREQHALALAALEEMSLDEKLALLVTYVDGLPGPEAAEILGVSFAAFRQRLSRARTALHARLETLMRSGDPGSAEVLARWQVLLNPGNTNEEDPGAEG